MDQRARRRERFLLRTVPLVARMVSGGVGVSLAVLLISRVPLWLYEAPGWVHGLSVALGIVWAFLIWLGRPTA